jgi:uncharacterized protein with FMN-binding domain
VAPTEKSRSGRKISSSLVAMSSAAVLAVYTAGYLKTKPAADQLDVAAAQRRVAEPPAPTVAEAPLPPSQSARIEIPPRSPGSRVASARPATTDSLPESPTAPALSAPATGSEVTATIAAPGANVPPAPDIAAAPQLSVAESAPPAGEPPAAAPVPPAVERGPYKDGSYTGWGYSRHGDIEATVTVEGGRIVSAVISKCQTRYSCGVVDLLPGQVLGRQRAKVDFVSGATQSSYAYEDAVAQALGKAQ